MGGEGRRVEVGESGLASWLWVNLMWSSLVGSVGDQCRESGERRKSRDQDFGAWSLERGPFFKSSRIRRCGRGSDVSSDGKSDSGIGLNDVLGSCNSSRISLIV